MILQSDRSKTILLMFLVTSLFAFGSSATEHLAVRLLSAAPLLALMISALVFRKPQFMENHFKEAVEKDSKRGAFSIKNLGLLVIIVFAVIFYSAGK